MKTKISLLLLFLAGIVHAQENYMSLSFGSGTPIGDYANTTSLANEGFAIQGLMGDYSGAYYPVDYWGIAGTIKFNQNSIDRDATRDALIDLIPETPPGNNDVTLDLGYWSIVSIGIGPQFTLPAGKFSFDAYFLPGLHIIAPPKMQLIIHDGEDSKVYRGETQNLRFGFESGIAFRYQIGSNTGLRLSASYLQTSSKGELLSDLAGQVDSNKEVDFTTKIQIVNIGIGLVIRM